jgi:LuxR family maltose regulon positive regulatory protein
LDDILSKPVTLLAAPAGYGKSTLLLEWLSQSPIPSCWISLDESDNDLHLYAAYLVGAIQTIFVNALPTSTGLIDSGAQVPPLELATTLSNEIAELPIPFVLVLDDYHCVKSNAIHEFMSDLIRRLPAPLHLIIVTRSSAPLPLGKLRAQGQLGELRAHDLRFTLDETRAFLIHELGQAPRDEWVARLQERIEGWAACLRFASFLLRENPSSPDIIERLVTQQDRQLMDYMLGEILSQKSPPVQEFMLKTAFLERFTAPVCQAIMGTPNAADSFAILDELVRDDLLILERDENERWYRYIDLFRDFLRARAMTQFDTQQITKIHFHASNWFVQRGFITDGIRYSIGARDRKRAAQIVGENLQPAFDHAAVRPLVESWLALFPVEMLDKYVELVMARVWLLGIELRPAAIPPLLARAEELLAAANDMDSATRRRIEGEIAYHRIAIAYFSNNSSHALELVQQNRENLPDGSGYVRGNVLTFQAWSLRATGKLDAALQLLTRGLQEDASHSREFVLRLLLALSNIYLNEADLINVEQTSLNLLRLGMGRSKLVQSWAHHFLGWTYYEWNRMEAASQHFAAAAELRHQGNLKAGHEGLAWLALSQQAQGFTDAANATMQELRTFTSQSGSGALEVDAASYRARLALMQGNTDAARHWVDGVSFAPAPDMDFAIEPHLTRLRVLLATRKPQDKETALRETEALLCVARDLHNKRRAIQLYALQAMAQDALGNRAHALDSLAQAVSWGEAGGFLRTFLELGPGMARLLNHLQTQGKSAAYIQRILSAGAHNGRGSAADTTLANETPRLVEPLTLRELQIMQHLAQQYTNKEIAQKLVISPQTVKAHIDHIHQKLGVNNRHEAVRVALAFGLIESPKSGATA